MTAAARTWGMWHPVPDEATGPGTLHGNPLEWWPSARAAGASLRARVQRNPGTVNTDTVRRADGTVRDDAQFYGSTEAVIFLYEVDGEPGEDPRPAATPHAVLTLGPRGGIQRRPLLATETPGSTR